MRVSMIKTDIIKTALDKANKAESRYNKAMNQLLNECQHFCNFELIFCEYQSGDGFCLGYEANGYDNNLISVNSFIDLVAKHKRKLELEDVIKTF